MTSKNYNLIDATKGVKMKVLSKQLNTKNCFICGVDNPHGLKVEFYNMENNMVSCLIDFKSEYQSYPGRVHGGIISTLFDELMGRVLWVNQPNKLAVTTTMSVKFRKPTPYNQKLKAIAYFDKFGSRMYSAIGKLYDENNTLLAEATGNYFIMPAEAINSDVHTEDEFLMTENKIPEEIDFVL